MALTWFCPKGCAPKRACKRTRTKGERICKECKTEFLEKDVTPIDIATDSPPKFPCPKCKKETKRMRGTDTERICSNKACREVSTFAAREHKTIAVTPVVNP